MAVSPAANLGRLRPMADDWVEAMLSEVKVSQNEAPLQVPADFKELCYQAREYLLKAEPMLQELRRLALAEGMAVDATGDMVANIVLAYRHLEDCRMRVGKAVQAFDGGTSVYPR